jgi:hypothetical protein
MEVKEIKTRKTFKDVHKDLENEHIFLLKNHDLDGFKKKSSFLKTIGFWAKVLDCFYIVY